MLIRMSADGTVNIPEPLRDGLRENTFVDVVRRDDGVIELPPLTDIDPDQAWFWTERWQQMEREADEDYAAGRYKTFDDVESFLKHLNSVGPATKE